VKHPVRKLIVLGAVVLLAAGNSGRSSGDLGRNPAGTVTPNLSTDSRYGTPAPAP
jgi:hypothetical protein